MGLSRYRAAMRQYAQDFDKASAFGGDWYPPAGTSYHVALVELREEAITIQGEEVIQLIPDLVILDGELANRKFPLGRFSQRNFGILKGVVRTINDGLVPETLDGCVDILEKAATNYLTMTVEIGVSENKKTGKTFKNVNITNVFPVQPNASAPPVEGAAS